MSDRERQERENNDGSSSVFHPYININTILSALVLASIIWLGSTTNKNQQQLVIIGTQLPYVNDSVRKLETQIGSLVTRAELESRFAEAAAKDAVLDKRLLLLEFEAKKHVQAP